MKTLDVRHLTYFIALAEERSFTRAAARVHISQPSLSGQMNRLEQFLGFALFQRSTRTVELTPEGEKILAQARATIEASTRLLELTREIREGTETTVRVGAPSLTALRQERKELFAAMAEQLPAITFEFVGMTMAEQLDALRRWQVDVTFYIAHTLDESDEFEHLVIQRRTVDLLVDADSPLAKKSINSLRSLRNVPIAVFARSHSPALFDRIAEVLGNRAGARLIVPAEAHPFSIAAYAAEHQIAAVHSEWFHHGDMLPPGMVQRRISGDPIIAEMSLVRLHGRPYKRGVSMFWLAAGRYLESQGTRGVQRSRPGS